MYDAVKGVMEDNGMLEKSAAVAAKARECGAKVFHIGIQFKQDHSDNPNGGMGILEACKGAELFTEGTWNAGACNSATYFCWQRRSPSLSLTFALVWRLRRV